MKIWEEFKAFALKGNVIDLAAAVILGAAVSKVVNSLVDNVIMPPIGWLIGGIDFSKLAIHLPAGPMGEKPVEITYGVFINAVVNFMIVAWALFLLIQLLNRIHLHGGLKKPDAPAAPPPPSEEVSLLREIRDSLKK